MAKLIKCQSCGKEIADTAKSCPGCGAKIKKPIYKKVWFWIIIVFVAIGITAGGSNESSEGSSSKNKDKTQTTSKQEELVLEDGHTGSPDEYGVAYYIEGYIKNNSNKDFSYIQVEFTAYDADGNVLDSCLANNSGLEAKGRWKFKAMCTKDVKKIASYKLKNITKW